jgi:hypothetical protein
MVGEACPGEGRGPAIRGFAASTKSRRGCPAGACPRAGLWPDPWAGHDDGGAIAVPFGELVAQQILNACAILKHMSERVDIALDDFGTGYSSLSYQRSFPFDKIKIDGLFISEMATRDDCAAIVSSIVSLAARLGMTTTAEGVETAEQLELVRNVGCSSVQGYLFDRPEPIRKVVEAMLV